MARVPFEGGNMPPRVLIVEDDLLQQEALKSALEKRGYEIETASDGLTAVQKLRTGGYDLALMDYHLPEVDGLQDFLVAEERPKLIAFTADSDDLARREAAQSVFDAIVPKPAGLPGLLTIIDQHLRSSVARQAVRAVEAIWRTLGLAGAPAVIALPEPTPLQAQMLRCYFDLSGQREPQAVLLLGREAADEAVAMRTNSAHFGLPFVDLTGSQSGADATFSAADHATWNAVAAAITRFTESRRVVARNIAQIAELDTRLLIYLFLSGLPFQPVSDVTARECVRYPGFFPEGETRLAAERLADRGLVERLFFERFHVCSSCGSSRLNVREECPACLSSHLQDTALIHHFRCAHQAAETDFIRGPHLICPKCRQQLRHYGSDYDKPGMITVCCDCGAVSAEPAIGFACLDCGVRTDGHAATTRDIFAYALTPKGIALLRRGAPRIVDSPRLAAAPIPPEVRDELRRSGPVAALIELHYGARERILASRGPAAFKAMRRLFLENLANILEGDCMLVSGPEADHLLVRSASPETLAGLNAELLEACQDMLTEGLEPELHLLKIPTDATPDQ
jgi:CheY-like chemotaxis protein